MLDALEGWRRAVSLCERFKFSLASWVLINPVFHGISLDQIMLSWKEAAGLNAGL